MSTISPALASGMQREFHLNHAISGLRGGIIERMKHAMHAMSEFLVRIAARY